MAGPPQEIKKQSFLAGAMVLAAGSFISRVLGALYRIFLPHIMGGGQQGIRGVGLFQMAYPVYQILLSLSAVGIPLAISKLVAERITARDAGGAWRVHRVSIWMLLATGLTLTAAMYFGAGYYAEEIIQVPEARYSIQALAPAVFFVSIMSGYRGFFQGLQNMTPHAISQVVEQVIRVLTMFVLAALLLDFGVEFSAAGAAFGAVTGALAALAYLFWLFRTRHVAIARAVEGGRRETLEPLETAEDGPAAGGEELPADDPPAQEQLAAGEGAHTSGQVVWRLVRLAVPISMAGLILPLMNMVDATVVPIRLNVAGYTTETVQLLFGDLAGLAFPFINVPAIFTGALAIALVPAISEAFTARRHDIIQRNTGAALRITVVLTLPAAVGLYLLAEPIPDMIWSRPEAGAPLAMLAFVALFLPVQQATSGILQGLGVPEIPMRNLFIGGLLKVALTWYLTAIPAWGVVGAALGSTLGFLVASGLNVLSVYRRVGYLGNVQDLVVKPAAAVIVMALVVQASFTGVDVITEHVMWPTLASMAAGVLSYVAAILAIGGVRRRDLELVPRFGPRLARLLDRVPGFGERS